MSSLLVVERLWFMKEWMNEWAKETNAGMHKLRAFDDDKPIFSMQS